MNKQNFQIICGPEIYPATHLVEYETFLYPGGERSIRLANFSYLRQSDKVRIKGNIESSDQIMELFLVVDAVRRVVSAPISLVLPYLPYARQDRVTQPGESLSIKVMCGLINSLDFEYVEIWDAHSDVPLALLNNVRNYGPECFLPMVAPLNSSVLVSPDQGATKKVFKVAKGFGRPMIQGYKIRDTKTGEITGTEIHSGGLDISDQNLLIVDDICDGGRTFIELAKVLRHLTSKNIFLYVTHGIFSKGLHVFDGLIDHIYVANPFSTVDINDPIITKLGGYHV